MNSMSDTKNKPKQIVDSKHFQNSLQNADVTKTHEVLVKKYLQETDGPYCSSEKHFLAIIKLQQSFAYNAGWVDKNRF